MVLGKVIEIKHILETNQKTIIDENCKEKLVYTAKPKIKKEESVAEWREICRFKGEPYWNEKYFSSGSLHKYIGTYINISENEEVYIWNKVFRADLVELHLFSNKILEEIDINAVDAAEQLYLHTREFNKQMIESNEKMKAYCDLHSLKYEESDCEKVFELVYPGREYKIVDGKMQVLETGTYKLGDLTLGYSSNSSTIDTLESSVSNFGAIATSISNAYA